MRIRLSDDRRANLLRAIKQHFAKEFDDPISDFRARGAARLVRARTGPARLQQGVRDACGYVQEKLGDIEGEIDEPEPPR